MDLAAVLAIPALAAALVLHPRVAPLAAGVTLFATVPVLALALVIAVEVVGTGEVIALGGWLACDGLSALVLVLVAFVGATAALFSAGYLGAKGHGGHRDGQRYYALYNVFLLSMLAVPLMAHVALTWIAVSLTTLLSAFLVGFEDTPEALEAAWKYVVLTTLGAVIALLGILILYWGARTAGAAPFTWSNLLAAAPRIPPAALWAGFVLVLIGFGTKAGLAPMHTWLPDAHSQAPASICALLSGVETTTALYAILRLFPPLEAAELASVRTWFVAFGLISVAVAALLLIHVRDYKRMFAFSTVEHMGIVLVAVGLGGGEAYFGAAYQMTAHALAKSFCFYAAGIAVLAVGTQQIADVRGLLTRSPAAAFGLLLGGLAIAGAPPFAVFVSEFAIFRAGLADAQYWTVGVLASLVVVAFCAILHHISRMVFGVPAQRVDNAAAAPTSCLTTLLIAAIPLVVLGLYVPNAVARLLAAAAAALGSGP